MIDETDQSIGAYFGFFQRKNDQTPTLSLPKIQQQLASGLQWSSIDNRLQAIEDMLRPPEHLPNTPRQAAGPGLTERERLDRIKQARIAVGRDELPTIYLSASGDGSCEFPTLFTSRHERIVRLIENPPQLRPQGFGVYADNSSQIMKGALRRNMIVGYRLLELWRDGLVIFMAPGDEDFLGWSTSNRNRPIRINNFVLAGITLTFCWLMKFVFAEANPKPPTIKLTLGFEGLTRPIGAAILSDVPDGTMWPGNPKSASDSRLEVFQLADLLDYDAERIAYSLLEDLYHWFGFESAVIPYVDRTGETPRLSAQKIIGGPLPESLPALEFP